MTSAEDVESIRASGPDSSLLTYGSVALVVGLAVFTVVRLLLPGDKPPIIADDLRAYYYPSYLSAYSQLAQGSLPLWNPYQLAGLPRLGVLQGGIAYPFHVVFVLLSTPVAMATLAILHIAIVALSTVAFARRLGMMWFSCLLAGVLVSMRGQFPTQLSFPNYMEASVWLVPGCIAILDLARGRLARPVALLAFSAGMSLLAGYPQATVYCAYTWGALLILFLVLERASPRDWLRAFLGMGGAIALGSMVAGVQLLPAFEMLENGSRQLRALRMRDIFPAGRMPGDLVTQFKRYFHYRGTYPPLPFSLGVVALSLLPAALIGRRNRGYAWVLAGLGVAIALITLGPVTPLFQLHRILPLMDSFRIPERARFVADFCLAIVAAGGLDAAARAFLAHERDRWDRMAVGGAALASVTLAIGLAGKHWDSKLYAVLFAALLLAAWRWAHTPRRVALFGGLSLLLALIELLATPPYRIRIAYAHPEVIEIFHERNPLYEEVAKSHARVWVVSPGLNPVLPRKLTSAHEMFGLIDYEPNTTRRQADYFSYLNFGPDGLEPNRPPFKGSLELLDDDADPKALRNRARLLELADMRWILTERGTEKHPDLAHHFWARSWDEQAADTRGTRLWKREGPSLRAYNVYRVEPAPEPQDLFRRISRGHYDPTYLSFVEGDPGFEKAKGAPLRGGPVRIVEDTPNRVVLDAEMKAPGMVVLADTFYPGWRATVSGERVEIRPVNHLFRGVPVPSGRHVIEFEYRPRSVLLGAASTGIALLVCLLLALLPRLRRGSSRSGAGPAQSR